MCIQSQGPTIENGLAQSHDRHGVSDHERDGPNPPSYNLFPLQKPQQTLLDPLSTASDNSCTIAVNNPEVEDVTDGLDDIQNRLRSSKSIARIIGRPAIDIVDLAVERVRRPDGGMESPAGHAMRSQQHIARVPCDQGHGDDEPDCQRS